MKMRLQKFLAQGGVASRRKSEELILAGRIFVNGTVIKKLGVLVDDKKDVIKYQNRVIKFEPIVIYMLNKPIGVSSTVHDKHAEKKVTDYIASQERIYPVGRLDKDTEGLILLTNNGELANKLMHPRYEHEKEYVLEISGVDDSSIKKFEDRFNLDGNMTKPMRVAFIKKLSGNHWSISLILKEGKKRQIRRVAKRLGYKVTKLRRVRIGKLKLGSLELGKWKIVSETDIL